MLLFCLFCVRWYIRLGDILIEIFLKLVKRRVERVVVMGFPSVVSAGIEVTPRFVGYLHWNHMSSVFG
jgi:hypothetical protein